MTAPRIVLNVGPNGSSIDLSTGYEVCQRATSFHETAHLPPDIGHAPDQSARSGPVVSNTSRERRQAFGAALGYELREGEQPSELAARIEEDFRLARAESYQQGRDDAAAAIDVYDSDNYSAGYAATPDFWAGFDCALDQASALARGGEVEGDPST